MFFISMPYPEFLFSTSAIANAAWTIYQLLEVLL